MAYLFWHSWAMARPGSRPSPRRPSETPPHRGSGLGPLLGKALQQLQRGREFVRLAGDEDQIDQAAGAIPDSGDLAANPPLETAKPGCPRGCCDCIANAGFRLSPTKFRIGVKFWGDRHLGKLRQRATVAREAERFRCSSSSAGSPLPVSLFMVLPSSSAIMSWRRSPTKPERGAARRKPLGTEIV